MKEGTFNNLKNINEVIKVIGVKAWDNFIGDYDKEESNNRWIKWFKDHEGKISITINIPKNDEEELSVDVYATHNKETSDDVDALETYLSEEIYYQVLRDHHDAFLSIWEQKKSEHSEDIKRMYQWIMSSMVCEIKDGDTDLGENYLNEIKRLDQMEEWELMEQFMVCLLPSNTLELGFEYANIVCRYTKELYPDLTRYLTICMYS
jgi:hypothetical protein